VSRARQYADAYVHGQHAVRACDYGVEVGLGKLGKVTRHRRQAQQKVLKPLQVDRPGAAVAEQQRRAAWRGDEVVDIPAGERGQAGGVVGEQFGGGTAEPEPDKWPKTSSWTTPATSRAGPKVPHSGTHLPGPDGAHVSPVQLECYPPARSDAAWSGT
jgi:hypothetical protein